MRRIGLTGGIGTGKSTAAAVFRRLGVPVFDADAAVRKVQGPGGAALPRIGTAFPGTVRDGALDREALRRAVLQDRAALRRLEGIVHPLVHREEARFLAAARRRRAREVVLDIPLLLETGRARDMDHIVITSAPPAVQAARVLRRPGMTAERLAAIRARQLSDPVRRRHADLWLRNGLSKYWLQARIRRYLAGLRA